MITLLFVPGNKPELFSKAEATKADGIIIDLEDSISDPSQKDLARKNVIKYLKK